MKLWLKCSLAASMVVAAAVISACQPDAEKARAVEALIEVRLAETQITGLAAAVVYQGQVLTARGYGMADLANDIAVNDDTRFQIGSTTKLFTALAVMQLVERGHIQLDDDIRTYLPQFNPKALSSDALPVTVRDLLTHHSGIPSAYLRSFVMDDPDAERFMQTSDWLSQTYLTWEHQQVFAYCNACFSLMGELVATVSQQPFADYIEQNIFTPLALNDSLVFGVPGVTDNTAHGYSAGEPAEPLLVKDVPAGSFLMSANDMAKFAQALVRTQHGYPLNDWLSTDTLDAMLEQQFPGLPMNGDFKIGLGFWLNDHHGRNQVGHGGTVPPFYSELKILPESGTAVFVAANDNLGNNAVLDELAADIFDLLLPPNDRTETPAINTANIDDGDYNLGGFGLVSIVSDGDTRQLALPGIGRFTLTRNSQGWYAADLDMELRPYSGSATETPLPIAFHGYLNGYLLGPATSLETHEANESYQPWLGEYESDDLVDGVHLYYDDERRSYRMDASLGVLGDGLAVTLKPVNAELMQVQGYGRNVGNVIQLARDNGEPVVRYSGITFHRSIN
ncbi:hypothetical protein BGP77_00210 [Saccharospirillum sp. MSK14-1]|uniref:serine hydrolase domain-containing protein n=1 Tax=Saccharospirillum sp. MSK14-1 TaxID=1897632 RepID=UPI000D38BDF7|nr:serine hydrolase domain-containing protein [Saccharospirillum sp. MSK14-1]PTY35791.1 hypothetical protein BGP77_00210 [Saccharospirillum sp. MSK14-1]